MDIISSLSLPQLHAVILISMVLFLFFVFIQHIRGFAFMRYINPRFVFVSTIDIDIDIFFKLVILKLQT